MGFIENNVYTRVRNYFSTHERVILVFISRVAKQRGNKHQNNTRVSTETVRYESTCISLFLTRYNESINDDKNDNLYTSSPCPTRSVFVLLMTSQWSDNCDVVMWIMIFNSLDIDFINGDIHGRSCKNVCTTISVRYKHRDAYRYVIYIPCQRSVKK